jgi:hypothetical protein
VKVKGIPTRSNACCIVQRSMGADQSSSGKHSLYLHTSLLSHIRQVDEGHTAWYQLQHPFDRVRESIPLDVQSSSSWLLFHQALWHTYAHHDAEGYGTWSQVLHWLKIWVLMRSPGHDKFESRKDIYEASNKLHHDAFTGDGEYSKNSERFVIYASPGDLM